MFLSDKLPQPNYDKRIYNKKNQSYTKKSQGSDLPDITVKKKSIIGSEISKEESKSEIKPKSPIVKNRHEEIRDSMKSQSSLII